MKQSCVSAFARVARVCALAAVALGLGAGSAFAQSTGKIEGRVRDQAGAPIANAQIVVVGTAYSALTNPQGYYFINNVPAGVLSVRAAFIGYRATVASNIRVLAGQTVTQDVQLEQSTVVVEDIQVVTTQPLVPRDEVTTRQRVSGDFSDKLPVDRISNVLALQPGVVASNTGTSISIRGGRTDEAATYVDGVPVQAGKRGSAPGGANTAIGGNEISIATNSFEEASVTTGASSAEFGNAQSGIINIATRTGSSEGYNGNIEYETDEFFGRNSSLGFNRIQAGVGGPLRLINGLTFYLSGALEGQKSPAGGMGSQENPLFVQAGVDTTVAVPSAVGSPTSDTTYVDVYNYAIYRGSCDEFANSSNEEIANNYGVECQGVRLPNQPNSTYQVQGKVNYSYGTGSRLTFLFLGSQNQNRRFSQSNPAVVFGSTAWNRVYQVNWTQNLSKSSERALALDASLSYQQDRLINSPLTTGGELETRNPFGGFLIKPLDYLFDFDNFALDSQLLDNFRYNRLGTRRSPLDLENTDQYRVVDQYRNNAFGVTGFGESGGPIGQLDLNLENRLVGKAAMDWQFDRYNRLRFGGEYTRYKIDSYSHGLTTQAGSSLYLEKPIRWNAFLEDRLDLGDVVVVGGLRYDFYDSRASRPYALDTVALLAGTNTPNPFFGTYQYFPRIGSYGGGTFNVNGQEMDVLSFVRDESHGYLSPHVQVAFPVTEKTNFRLSYAHQVQAPDFGLVLANINTDLAITNTNAVFGADLDFGKTITFEFGIRHAFSDDMVLDVAAYNKDKLADAAGRLVSARDPTRRNSSVDLRTLTNADFGNIRGVDVRLDRRIGNLFNGTLAYSFQEAKNTGSDPFTFINFGSRIINQVSGGNQPPPQAIAPIANSRPHSLAGAFSINFPGDWREGSALGSILQNFGVFATLRYSSGTAYTKCESAEGNEGLTSGQVCNRGNFAGGLNTARLPSFKQFDVRLTKGFGLGGLDMTAFLDARNVLNFRNVLAVFLTTNDVVDDEERTNNILGTLDAFEAEALRNGIFNQETSDIDLRFGTQGASGCSSYVSSTGAGLAPNCIALIRAEQRYGDGDGVLTLDEQTRIANAAYFGGAAGPGTLNAGRGESSFLGAGRRLRFGLSLEF